MSTHSFWYKISHLNLLRRKSVLALLIIWAVLVTALLALMAAPKKQYTFESEACVSSLGEGTHVLYDHIHLKPGVYHVALHYSTDTDQSAVFSARDGSVFTGGLLTNGEHAYSALDRTDYSLWLYESTDSLEFTVDYTGAGYLQTGSLTVTETYRLWSMLLTYVLFFGGLIFLCMFYALYERTYGVAREKKIVFLLVTLAAVLASTPYLLGSSISGADLTYHLLRIEGVKDSIVSGQFPTRLEPKWVFDHGYANAIFYCPALLVFPAILRLLGFTVTASYNIFCVGLNFATAWIAYYSFRKIFDNYKIGIACSALYTLSIYRIYKLVITGAVGEGSAITFMPLVLVGIYRVFTEDPKNRKYRTAWLPIAFGYAGLIQTHILSCEVTALLTVIVCLIGIRKIFVKETFFELFKGAAGAACLSLWSLVPFLDFYVTQDVHIKHVSARTIQTMGLFPAQLFFHFFSYPTDAGIDPDGMAQSWPVGVGFCLLVGLIFFFALWLSGRLNKKRADVIFAKFTAVVSAMLLIMTLQFFPWDKIQFIHPIVASLVSSLQFPSRFLGWATALLVFIFGFCVKFLLEDGLVKLYRLGLSLVFLTITTSGVLLLDSVNLSANKYDIYNEAGMGFGYISGAEYLIQGTDLDALTFERPAPSEGVILQSYEKNYLHVDSTVISDVSDGYLDLPMLLYKGYHAVSDDGEELSLTFSENKNIRVLLPEGETRFTLDYKEPKLWRLAELVTVCSYAGLIVLWIVSARRRKGGALHA